MRHVNDLGRSNVLAAAAEPIHEAGHAVAVKLFTGIWPRFTVWAVFPPTIRSQEAALAILLAGDLAVLLGCLFVSICVRYQPGWQWAMIGPSFMAVISLASWFIAAAMSPFGMTHVGASDAAKFYRRLRVNPLWVISGVSLAAFGMPVFTKVPVSTFKDSSLLPNQFRDPFKSSPPVAMIVTLQPCKHAGSSILPSIGSYDVYCTVGFHTLIATRCRPAPIGVSDFTLR
jgi:hypothetical protein